MHIRFMSHILHICILYGFTCSTGGAPRWCDRFGQYGIKVGFWASGTLKIVIYVENYPQESAAQAVADYCEGGGKVIVEADSFYGLCDGIIYFRLRRRGLSQVSAVSHEPRPTACSNAATVLSFNGGRVSSRWVCEWWKCVALHG